MGSNEQITPPPPAFKNRRGGLIAFGVFQLLIAAAMFLFAALMLFIPTAEIAKSQPAGSPQVSFAFISIFYGVIGAGFVTLGIGSILTKNWARIGTLIVCWFWLGIGLISLLFTALLMPAILKSRPHPQQNLPPNFEHTVVTASLVMMGIIFVLIPSAFLIFYHGKNVKGTCTARHGGTESAKRPVLMTVLIFLFGFSLISVPIALYSKYPVVVFGHFFWGWLGKTIFLVFVSAEGIAMWAYIRRDIRGWWLAIIASLFWFCSTTVTFLRGDLLGLYRQMGMTEEQLAVFKIPHFLTSILVVTSVFMVARLAAIAYSRRYFVPNTIPTAGAPSIDL